MRWKVDRGPAHRALPAHDGCGRSSASSSSRPVAAACIDHASTSELVGVVTAVITNAPPFASKAPVAVETSLQMDR
jgi:hypothetical protein